MKKIFLVIALSFFTTPVFANPYTFGDRVDTTFGDWKTYNPPLEGPMRAVVTRVSAEEWRATFDGVWEGQPYIYTVEFTGPPNDLRGRATINGAKYRWRATIDKKKFRANFTGNRYTGRFDLLAR